MALTGSSAVASDLYEKQVATNSARESLRPDELGGRKRVVRVSHTLAAGDGSVSEFGDNDEMNLCVIPAGAVVDLKDSYVHFSAAPGNGPIFKIGTRAFTKKDGSTQAEDAAYLAAFANSGVLVTPTAMSTEPGNGADLIGWVRLNSREPVTLFCKAVANGGTFDGDIGDVWDFQISYVVD